MFHRWKERFLDKRSRATRREAVYKELADMKVCLALATADAEGQRAVEGLAGRMKGVKVEGVYLAEGKEGTIEGVDALGGYLPVPGACVQYDPVGLGGAAVCYENHFVQCLVISV